jgi:hypothetical protein
VPHRCLAALTCCCIYACPNQRNDEIQCEHESKNEKFAKTNSHSLPLPERTSDEPERAQKEGPGRDLRKLERSTGVNGSA